MKHGRKHADYSICVFFALLLIAAYIVLVCMVDTQIWPTCMKYGEPVTWQESDSRDVVEAKRLETKGRIIAAFYGTGISAFILYLFFIGYVLSWQSYAAMCAAAKWARKIAMIVQLCLAAMVIMLLFRTNDFVSSFFANRSAMLVVIIVLGVIMLFGLALAIRTVVNLGRESGRGVGIFSAVFQIVTTLLGGVVPIIMLGVESLSALDEVSSYFKFMTTPDGVGRAYVLKYAIDYVVAGVPLVSLFFLWLLMTFNAPSSIGNESSAKTRWFGFRTLVRH